MMHYCVGSDSAPDRIDVIRDLHADDLDLAEDMGGREMRRYLRTGSPAPLRVTLAAVGLSAFRLPVKLFFDPTTIWRVDLRRGFPNVLLGSLKVVARKLSEVFHDFFRRRPHSILTVEFRRKRRPDYVIKVSLIRPVGKFRYRVRRVFSSRPASDML